MLVWITALLFISFSRTHGLYQFPENFVVAEKDKADPVKLICHTKTTKTEGDVVWKFDGEEVDLEDSYKLEGKDLNVSNVELPMLGNYSCWSGEEMLSSTYLLLKTDEEEDLDNVLSCRAKSYNCNFTCSWTDRKYTAVRLGLGKDCREGKRSCLWERSRDQLHNGGFQFVLTHSLSPYAEESTMFELTAEAIVDQSIFRTTKSFYLRDIVQPDRPRIVSCKEVEQDLNVTIEPPSSWSTPHSFFTLEHEIEYMFKDDGKTGRSSSALIPKGISKLRVRSRDPLVLSAWSQWTPWKNVRKGKKNPCQHRKRSKMCFNQDHNCKKKRVGGKNKKHKTGVSDKMWH
ncbi:interleukin-12 subunit beta [Melanotaenia boesemani]|uniref:interleukin-12 subunit beta n=1 Tax=Melanotaenia boesemani TaxID=1250792 RepID=UPI001C0500A3|nr:interleukin-12 subunit beta [Melanotaenia boesemani]